MNWKGIFALSLVAILCSAILEKAAIGQFPGPTYTLNSTTVGTVTPIALWTPGAKPLRAHAKPRSGASPALCWFYTGATPTATPSPGNFIEITSSIPFDDDFDEPGLGNNPQMNQGFACVGEGATTMDSWFR